MTTPQPSAGIAAEAAAAPVIEEPKPASAKDKLAAAALPEKHVSLCLRADLQAEYEDLERQLAEVVARERLDQRLNSGGESKRIAEQIEALQEEMRDSTIVVKIRAKPRRRWDELVKKHPARKDDDEDQALGYNAETFFDAAIQACAFEPADFEPADWRELLDDKITAAQYNELTAAVMAVNIRKVSVPNSRAASRILRASESG